MSDLTSELRQMVQECTGRARPLPAAEVIRRGNRLHRRTLTQWTLSGVAAVAGVSVMVTGAVGGTRGAPTTTASGGGAAQAGFTLTATGSSADGRLTIRLTYRDAPHNRVKMTSLSYSGMSRMDLSAGKPPADLDLTFNPTSTGTRTISTVIERPFRNVDHVFAGSVNLRTLDRTEGPAGLVSGATVSIDLQRGNHSFVAVGVVLVYVG